jgi:acetyl-CoA acetyltransferase
VTKCCPQAVYLIDGARTPFGRHLRQHSSNTPAYSKLDLAVTTAQALLLKQAFTALQLDDIVLASSSSETRIDLAKQLSQRLHCNPSLIPHTFPAGENCGLQALHYAHQQIAFQQKSLILLGGVETIHSKPISLNYALSDWIREWQTAKGIKKKLKVFSTLHTHHFSKPYINSTGSNVNKINLKFLNKNFKFFRLKDVYTLYTMQIEHI